MKALIALLCLLLAPAALAADGLTIESCTGAFGTRLSNQQWNDWEVTVLNTSNQPQTARVLFRINRFNVTVLREVMVPANTRYPVRLALQPEFPAETFLGFFKNTKSTETRPDGSKREVQRLNGNLECIAALVDPKSGQEQKPFKILALLNYPGNLNAAIVDDDPAPRPFSFFGTTDGLCTVLGDRRLPASGAEVREPILLNEQFPSGEDQPKVQMTFANSQRLPDALAAYEGVELLVLGEHRPLNPAQQAALRQWLYGGGRLAVFPSGAVETFRNDAFWRELLPVILREEHELLPSDAAAFEKDFGGKLSVSGPLPPVVSGAMLKPDARLLGGTPASVLSARHGYGAGEVVFYALRGGDIKSAGAAATRYFASLTSILPQPLPGLDSRLRKNATNLLQSMTGLPVPQKWEAAALMLVFLIVATILLIVLRLKKRAEMGWPLLMVWSLLVFAAASVLMRTGASGLSLSSGEIGVTLADGATGFNRSTGGAFPFESVKGAFSWRQPEALLAPVASAPENNLAATTVAVWQDFYPGVPQVQMQQGQFWSARSFAPATIGKGVRAQVLFTGAGLRGSVRNHSGQKLQNCLISLNRRILYIGDLADGAEADLSRAELLTLADFARRDFGTGWGLRRNILSQILFPEDARGGLNTSPVFLGFTSEPRCDFTIDGARSRNNARQLIAVLPELKALEDAEIIIPTGVCGLELLNTGGATRTCYGYPTRPLAEEAALRSIPTAQPRRPGQPPAHATATAAAPAKKVLFDPDYDCAFPGWQSGNMQLRAALRFTLPAGLDNLRPTAATLHFKGAYSGMTAEVSLIRPADGKPQKIGTLTSGGGTLKLDSFTSFVGKDGSLPVVEIFFRPQVRTGGDVKWEIQELELQITGKTAKQGQP